MIHYLKEHSNKKAEATEAEVTKVLVLSINNFLQCHDIRIILLSSSIANDRPQFSIIMKQFKLPQPLLMIHY